MAREVTIEIEGKKPVVITIPRGLKRKEIRKLRKEKDINLFALPQGKLDEVMDDLFELLLSKKDQAKLDDMENKYASKVFFGIIAETWPSPTEVKN